MLRRNELVAETVAILMAHLGEHNDQVHLYEDTAKEIVSRVLELIVYPDETKIS